MSERMEMEGGGCLRFWEDAGRVFFRCERELIRDGLYKVWVCGDGGEFLLGTLMPEGEKLALNRTLWLMELRRAGCWPIRRAYCRRVYSFPTPTLRQQGMWRWEERPQQLVDAETAAVGEWGRMLVCTEGGAMHLAFPLKDRRPVPLSALICLAQVRKISGEICLVWSFDEQGSPVIPGKGDGESRSI